MVKSTYWLLRNLKLFFFVPSVLFLLYLPFVGVIFYRTYSGSVEIYLSVMFKQFQLFIPLFAVWWTIFTLKEFMESEGNELLYIYNKPLHILNIQLLALLLYAIHITVFMLGFNLFFDGHYFAILQLIISSFTMCAFAYFLSFAFRSTGIALLFSIAYAIFLNVIDLDKTFGMISIFPTTKDVTDVNIYHILLVFTVGVILFAAGFLFSKIRISYK